MTRSNYNKVVKLHTNNLYGYCLKSIRDKELAEDIVQDSFLKLWENRKKVSFDKSKSWLFVTAHNLIINMAKKAKRTQITDEIESRSPVTKENRFELNDLINDALEELPVLQRSILLFRDLEGYNYQEIGEMLNISDSKVRVYLFRARQKVKSIIKAQQLSLNG